MILDDRRNLVGMAGAWTTFLGASLLLPRLPYGLYALPLVCLAFQQYLAGVIHEAAHMNFFQGSAKRNEALANCLATFVFGYDMDAYRKEHFRHHQKTLFLNAADGRTAEYVAATKGAIFVGILKDLFFVTSAKMVLLRLQPLLDRSRKAVTTTGPRPKGSFAPVRIAAQSAVLWGGIALLGSPWSVGVFWLTLFTIYPLSNRIRVYGTHADVTKEHGAVDSGVAANVHSPLWERIFIGNRMMMYHYEHHLEPRLPYRAIEKLARERRAGPAEPEHARVIVPSYLYTMRKLLLA